MTPSELARFQAKTIEGPNGCLLWVGSLNNKGYGNLTFRGKSCKAHRVAYEHANGEIPAGLDIDHICRVRSCVRPEHLRAVTHRANVLAPGSENFAKVNSDKTHCIRGHRLEGDNLDQYFLRRCIGRRCRQCSRIHAKAVYARRKARRAACVESQR